MGSLKSFLEVLGGPKLATTFGFVKCTRMVRESYTGQIVIYRIQISLLHWCPDTFLDPLPAFGALETLELGSCFLITDEPVAACLRTMPRLRVLDVDRCKKLTDAEKEQMSWSRAPGPRRRRGHADH